MDEIENYIKISWQFVSQFVSWDFCRYTSEKNEPVDSDADVLTFLRNMIVERTENAASDITKQEIIARFIMETKTIKTVSRMSCITALANTVKRICPELKQAVTELVAHLDTFLEKLDYNENSEKIEIIQTRIADAVNSFSKKAYDVLPSPDLVKVIQAYLQSDSESPKFSIQEPKRPELYIQVLNLLRQELKHNEIENIAKELFDDGEFKRIMYLLEGKCDSLDISIGSSQIPPDSLQLSERYEVEQCDLPNFAPLEDNSLSLDNSQPVSYQKLCKTAIVDSQKFSHSKISEELKNPHRLAEKIDKLGPLTDSEAFLFENPDPIPLFPCDTQKGQLSQEIDFAERTFSGRQFCERKTSDPIIINIQSCGEESLKDEESGCDFITQRPAKLKYLQKHPRKKKREINSNSEDTSDCDNDPELRFLTPTFFKKGSIQNHKVFYVSDQESCGSSVITTYIDSQQKDPSFKTTEKLFTKPLTTKRKKIKKPIKKKKPKETTNEKQKTSRQTTLQQFSMAPKTSLNESCNEFKETVNKRKKFKLFNSDTCPPIPNKTPAHKRKPSKEIIQSLGNKRHCKECKMTFKTPSELKKHIFIFHTGDDFSD